MSNQWGMDYDDFLGDSYGDAAAAAGAAAGPAALVSAFSQSAMVVGQLIDLGFKAEYHPRRRMKLASDLVPRYLKSIKKLGDAQVQAVRKYKAWDKKAKGCKRFKRGPLKGKPKDPIGCSRAKRKAKHYKKLPKKIRDSRKLLVPFPLPPFAVPIKPQIDDHLNLEMYADMLGSKAAALKPGRGPGGKSPLTLDGGNIKTTRRVLEPLFSEVLIFSLLPEAAVMTDPELRGARDSAIATVMTVFNTKSPMIRIFGSNSDTKAGRMPKPLRNRIIRNFVEWHGLGMIPDNMPLPPWLFGFKVDGSEDPVPLPTVGAYLALNKALGQGRLNEAVIKRMKGQLA